MSPTQKLIIRMLQQFGPMTSRELAAELKITRIAVNSNLAALRPDVANHVYIKEWQPTGGRSRPVYAYAEIPRKDNHEPKQKHPGYYTTRSYHKARALRILKRAGVRASPWAGL